MRFRLKHSVFFFLLISLSSTAIAAEHEWKMASSWNGGPLFELGPQAFANKVELLTTGRIKIKVFHAGVLGKALAVSNTVKAGVAQVGHTWSGYDWGKDKTAVLFGGYAGSFSTELMLHWLYEGGGVELWKQWRKEKFGLVGMPAHIRTAEVFLHSHKPVKSLGDLKGLKLRTAGAWLEIAKKLGAAPVTSSGGDVYPMLERKVIDAIEWGTLYENITPGFYRIAKYIVIPGVHQPTAPFEIVINEKAWSKLSEQDKTLVEIAAKLTTFEGWTRLGQEDAKAYKFYLNQGNEIIELDEDTQIEARKLGLKWASAEAKQNPWFKKVFESQRAFENLWSDSHRYRNVKGGHIE